MIKVTIQQENVATVNIYAPNMETPKHIKQLLTKEKTDNNTIIVGDFNTPLTSIDRSDRKSIRRQ